MGYRVNIRKTLRDDAENNTASLPRAVITKAEY